MVLHSCISWPQVLHHCKSCWTVQVCSFEYISRQVNRILSMTVDQILSTGNSIKGRYLSTACMVGNLNISQHTEKLLTRVTIGGLRQKLTCSVDIQGKTGSVRLALNLLPRCSEGDFLFTGYKTNINQN